MGLWRSTGPLFLRSRRFFLDQGLETYEEFALWDEKDGSLHRMKRILALSLAFAAAAAVSACETPQQQNALVGGALGAGTGALIGSAVSGGSAGGALAGAAIGAGSGALIGSAATPSGYYGGPPPGGYYGGPPPRRCAQWAYDYNGNRVCTAFY
jgi:hypothetical protein